MSDIILKQAVKVQDFNIIDLHDNDQRLEVVLGNGLPPFIIKGADYTRLGNWTNKQYVKDFMIANYSES